MARARDKSQVPLVWWVTPPHSFCRRHSDAETALSAAQVLGCLAECETKQVSHSFALLNQVR